jgi:cell division septum initiation protein DivIVA
MSAQSGSRAAEIAAQQVESIVSAAQAAADRLRQEAEREAQEIRERGERDAARRLDETRAEALRLGQDARREADRLMADAQRDAAQLREQTRRQVEGRVAAAEKAAADVLEEARTLSGGLQRLGQMLGNQGERILRDVQAAHRRMQADLRVAPEPLPETAPSRSPRPARGRADEREDEALETLRRAVAGEREPRTGRERPARASERRSPIDDLDVPSWVDRP